MLNHFSLVQLFASPGTIACQAPLSMGFSRQDYWSGLLCPPLGDLPDPGIEPVSLTSPALSGRFFTNHSTDAGRDWGQEEKGMTENEMAGWHHWLDGRESEWTLGVGDGEVDLVCCDSWGHKESDRTERLVWSDLKYPAYAENGLRSKMAESDMG